jgi:hypothetical protein
MVQQANIKTPFACWKAIKGTNEEYSVLDDGTIEHLIMYPFGFFDDENNPLEWIAARVRVPGAAIALIECGAESMACNFAEFYDTDLIEMTFEV